MRSVCANIRYDFKTGKHLAFKYEQEAIYDQALSTDGSWAVLARGVGCNAKNQNDWALRCGLQDSFEVYNMKLLDLNSGERVDLVPGLTPSLSPDGKHLAFRSCLRINSNGQGVSVADGPPKIYAMDLTKNPFQIMTVSEGKSPRWRP
jgi:hypothetical protein